MPETIEIPVKDSILQSTKKLLGMEASYDAFDLDIITHINTAFSTLFQAGVGPVEGFFVTDGDDTWARFIGNKMHINDVKSYIYLRVQMLFDRPATSFALEAVKAQIDELIWRLNVADDFSILSLEPVIPPVTIGQTLFWDLSNGIDFPENAVTGDWGVDLISGIARQKTISAP